jgi:hypothetical protein
MRSLDCLLHVHGVGVLHYSIPGQFRTVTCMWNSNHRLESLILKVLNFKDNKISVSTNDWIFFIGRVKIHKNCNTSNLCRWDILNWFVFSGYWDLLDRSEVGSPSCRCHKSNNKHFWTWIYIQTSVFRLSWRKKCWLSACSSCQLLNQFAWNLNVMHVRGHANTETCGVEVP